MMSDHVAPTPDVTAMYPAPFYDPFTTLSWLASFTTRLSLGTSVAILPYRHPLLTARMSANLDQFTGGRFVLGVGVGWSEPEFGALGVSFPERGRITDEFLTVITRAWTEPSLSFTGDHVHFRNVATGPAPVRHPGPRLWVGGMGEGAIRRAARFGDAWHAVNPRTRLAAAGRSAPPR
jgi:probable F420-dependent oxidoreductase